MNDETFYAIWIFSFFLYFTIYTIWIPLKTQKKIESWLKSSESDETLLMSLDVITKKIREQMLIDFEEFMLPQARESLKKFWAGAMGNAAQELKGSEEVISIPGCQLTGHTISLNADGTTEETCELISHVTPLIGALMTDVDTPLVALDM